jgi:hypothetical protein
MFVWGTCTMCLGATNNYASVTTVRFLLGVFEAGLFPGLLCFTFILVFHLCRRAGLFSDLLVQE